MAETQLEAAKRELAALYKQLAMTPPFGPQRVSLQMRIARLRMQIRSLEGRR